LQFHPLPYHSGPLLCNHWPFEVLYSLSFSYFMYFYIEIFLSVIKSFVRGLSHLKFFALNYSLCSSRNGLLQGWFVISHHWTGDITQQ
jgi:hypothetical protein